MYQRILVPVDGSPTSNLGLKEAIELAKVCGAQLRLVHVVDEMSLAMAMNAYSGYVGDWLTLLRDGGKKIVDASLQAARAAGIEAESCMFDSLSGSIDDLILAEADRCKAGLIVLGTHGRRGPRRWLLGSTAETIARRSAVPVLLVRDPCEHSAIDETDSAPQEARAHISLPAQALAIE